METSVGVQVTDAFVLREDCGPLQAAQDESTNGPIL